VFFILPLAHEESSVRRWPLFAIAVIVLNALLLAVTMTSGAGAEDAVARATEAAQTFADMHAKAAESAPPGCVTAGGSTPGANILQDMTTPKASSGDLADMDSAPNGASAKQKPSDPRTEAETEAADAATMAQLCAAITTAESAKLDYRFGFIPRRPVAWTLVTHQFLHAGVLHLLLNLWFFWLTGCNLEDRWGKAVFGGFYLLAGVAGALVHWRFTSSPDIPLIGASAAIAGAMGAFLVVLGRTRVRFGYLMWLSMKPKVGTFEATAFWMFPLWIVAALCQALFLTDSIRAQWAPIGGFVFGVAVGLAMKYSGFDARLDASANDANVVVRQDARIAAAAALTDQGKLDEASRELEAFLRESPDDVDALIELLRAVTASRDVPRRIAVAVRLMNAYLGKGFADAAADVYAELRQNGLESEISRGDAMHLGEAFARRQRVDAAILALRHARRGGLADADAVKACVAEATLLARSGKTFDAKKLFDECKASPFLTFDLEQRIETQLQAMQVKAQ
jgi:membrane associated rhomboid family serine protease